MRIYIIVIILMIIVASCKSVDPASRYSRVHSGNSYESAMKQSESFTIKSFKEDRKDLKAEIRSNNKKSGSDSKKERLEKELEILRAKAENNK